MSFQSKLELLVAEFARDILRTVGSANLHQLDELLTGAPAHPARTERVKARGAVPAPPRPTPPTRAAASKVKAKAKAKRTPAPKQHRAVKSAPAIEPKRLEQTLLRHLRSGVLLSPDNLGGLVGVSEALVSAAVDRLVDEGLVGLAGEGADRLVFAVTGRAARSASPTKAAAAPKAPVIAPAVAEEVAPVSEPTPAVAPPSGAHPFVIRRKKAATGT